MKLELQEKEKRELASLLKRVPIFSELDDKTLKELIKDGKEISYPSGKKIMEEGQVSAVFHLILEGSVEIKKKHKTLATLTKGQFFGEMGLIDREPRSADIITIEPTRCFAMTAWAFQSYLKTELSIALEVVRVLARRLRETDNALTE
jgi:CRP/FNR family cyclic AMP-dependent transcriptional regulator